MSDLPSHILPNYSEAAREDALFHYTTAKGLIGVFATGELWGTAYYCANDEHELVAGKGVLTPLIRSTTHGLAKASDARLETFRRRGVNAFEYADHFEQLITSLALSSLCAYLTCFYKPIGKEDFIHGLLSQWRGYGADGGYSLQFSRSSLVEATAKAREAEDVSYEIQDVHYELDNPAKAELLKYSEAFVGEYSAFLDEQAQPLDLDKRTMRNPITGLFGGPLESLLDYLVHTKNAHFGEERECRLSLIQPVSVVPGARPIHYFDRNGLIVPYTTTPRTSFDVLDCVEWIVVGPGPRMQSRFNSALQLVRQSGKNIKVRASHIPFTRL